jgi:antitoxin HicB
VLAYPIELTPDDNGTLLVTCPDLPEVTTFGENERDALNHAVDAVEVALASRIAPGEPVPPPSLPAGRLAAPLPALSAAKVELYRALAAAGLGVSDLAARMGVGAGAAEALLDLDRPTPLPQLEAAFRSIGKRLGIAVLDAA